ncbi:putative metalloprotease CJM1_0395 family protein [Desulfobacterota bacterium M19]
MNINSLLAGLTVPAVGQSADRARVNNSHGPFSPDAGRDSFTRSTPSSSSFFPPLYTRATAVGGLRRSADRGDSRQPSGAAEQQTNSNVDKDAAPEQGGRDKGLNGTSKNPAGPKKPNGTPLSSSEKLLIDKLQKVDQEVHDHELAHLAAAGGYAVSGASYQYQTGPDGRKYAVGGEVQIDTSPGRTPEETISKMETVRRAALAPASPSGQDQLVAAQATVRIASASRKIVQLAAERNAKESEAAAAAVKGAQSGRDNSRTPVLQAAGAALMTSDSSAVRPLTSQRTRQAIRQYLRSATGSFGRVV